MLIKKVALLLIVVLLFNGCQKQHKLIIHRNIHVDIVSDEQTNKTSKCSVATIALNNGDYFWEKFRDKVGLAANYVSAYGIGVGNAFAKLLDFYEYNRYGAIIPPNAYSRNPIIRGILVYSGLIGFCISEINYLFLSHMAKKEGDTVITVNNKKMYKSKRYSELKNEVLNCDYQKNL